MSSHRAIGLICVLLPGLALVSAGEPENGKRGEFLAPAELAELADKSSVSYGTRIVKSASELPAFEHPGYPKDGPARSTLYPIISEGKDGGRSLMAFTLSAVASKALDEAEPKYQANHYGEALMIYRDALTHDPDCYVLHMNAGDCYLFSGNPLAALASYDRALELNRSDFHAHWYRGSALLELDRRAEARASYARALALSPRQGNLIQSINNRSDRLGFRARGDLFHPLAVARHEGDTFNIYSVDSTHWWIYGLCRAIWLAEAGHRKNLTGREGHGWTNTEELECTANLLVSYRTDRDSGKSPAEPELDHLLEVLDAHRLGAFVDYEFGSRVAGDYSVLLDRDAQDRLVEFVDRFVFEPVATGH